MSTTASTTSARTPTTGAAHRYGDPSTRWALLGAETMLSREPRINTRQRWEYEDGLVLNGIHGVYRDTGDVRFLDYVRTNIDEFVQPDGTIRHYAYDEFNLDHVNNGKAILDLLEETGDERYRAAADTLFDQLQHQPRTSEGSFWHKRIYPDQVWLDGLYMGSVFYARYCALVGRSDLVDDVVRQFTNAYDLTLDPATGLCRHAYDATRSMYWADAETGLSPHVWLRALGWFAMAMVDVQAYLPQDHPGRAQIRTNLAALLTALQRYADPATNLWFQIPDQAGRPMNYLESSGSLMVLSAIATSLRLGYLAGPGWDEALERGWTHAREQFLSITAEGWVNVHKMCQVAGLGGATRRDGSYAYYMSEPIVTNDHKGYGPFLLLATEMERRR